MQIPILTISIVHFNTFDETKKCIESIFRVLDVSPVANRYEISIIDNRSRIDQYQKIEEYIKELKRENVFLQRNCMNSGFGLGCMLSLNQSAGKYIAFVNSDTFFSTDCFTPLIDLVARNPQIGVITPQHLNEAGDIIRSYGFFENLSSRFFGKIFSERRRKILIESDRDIKAEIVDFVYGSFMLVQREAFEKIGGFDPNIFLYYEEMDLCLRMKKAGYVTCYYPVGAFHHIGSASTGVPSEDLKFESFLSMLYVIKKHRGSLYGILFYIVVVTQLMLKAPFKSKNRRAFFRSLSAWMPQSVSLRNKQTCEFIE